MVMQKRKPKHDKIREQYQRDHLDPLVKAFADYYNKRGKELKERGKNFRTAVERRLYDSTSSDG